VAKGYSQVEGLDFEKTFALVACLKTIRILLDDDMPFMDTTTSSWSDTNTSLNMIKSFLCSSTNYF
jgi:hypothetical protein